MLSRRTYHSDSERRIPVTESRDIAARHPPLGAQSSRNSIGFSCRNVGSRCKVVRLASSGLNASHDYLEMSRLISRQGPDIGAIDKDGNWVRSDTAHAMRARQISRLDLIRDPRESISTTRRRVSVSSSGIHTSGRNPLAWSFASTAASIYITINCPRSS